MLDSEAIIGHYLRTHPDIDARVLGELPDKTTEPWVVVTLIDPTNSTGNSRVEHLMSYYLQLDCYAGAENDQPEAFDLADAVRDALIAAVSQTVGPEDEGFVTNVHPVSMPRIPDDGFEPARQRYILDVEVFMRPAREGEGGS